MACTMMEGSGMDVQFSPFDGSLLWVASSAHFGLAGDSKLSLFKFDPASSSLLEAAKFSVPNAIFALAASEAIAGSAAVACGDGHVRIFEVSKGVIADLAVHQKECTSISASHLIPTLLATGGADGRVSLLDVATRSVDVVKQGPAFVNQVVWHPRHKNLLALAAADGEVSVLDLRAKAPAAGLREPRAVSSVDFNKFSDSLAIGTADNSIKYFDLRNTKMPLLVLQGHRYGVKKLKFSPFRDHWILSASLFSHQRHDRQALGPQETRKVDPRLP